MHKFEKLNVYQKALEFTTEIYGFSKTLPADEKYGLISQLRRATTSIVLNIAEGAGAGSDLEFRRFLRIALRSNYEVHAIIDVIIKLKLANQKEALRLKENLDEIGAMISGLIKKLS